MKQRENINFELLRNPILDYCTNTDSDAPQNIMSATVLCCQEKEVCCRNKEPSEDAEIIHVEKVVIN